VWSRGHLRSRIRAGKAEAGVKFTDYFEFSEPLAKLPSHRILALFRGEKEEVLSLELVPELALATGKTQQEITTPCKGARANHVGAAIARHKRAGRIEERDGKLYATQSAGTEQRAAI
jgi:transcriptional accessory protein Tex/SPT6